MAFQAEGCLKVQKCLSEATSHRVACRIRKELARFHMYKVSVYIDIHTPKANNLEYLLHSVPSYIPIILWFPQLFVFPVIHKKVQVVS